jgi:hypothetical protein
LEACRRLGIHLEELIPVTEDFVKQKIIERDRRKNVPKELVQIRMDHYNEKRDYKIKQIKEV